MDWLKNSYHSLSEYLSNFFSSNAGKLTLGWCGKVIAALAILFIGRWLARKVSLLTRRSMEKAKVDPTLIGFSNRLIFMLLMVFVITAALRQLGVDTASMIAIVGAAGLAIGLALQGALSNFAAGVLIIMFRPFRVGDLIEAGDTLGVVRVIELFTTTLVTLDNKTAIIPNSQLTSDKITNYTETEELRMDMVFGVGYEADIDKVKKICYGVLNNNKRILQSPAPFVGVLEHGESSVNFAVRPWVSALDYWDIHFEVHEEIKKAFDAADISIPFPQRDVHLISNDKN